MRAIVIVIALVIASGTAYFADVYWYGGSYSRMVVHSVALVISVLINNW
jgi:hypothetical protein